jgi:hypothetical protein
MPETRHPDSAIITSAGVGQGGSVVVPVRGAVAEQAVAVRGFWAVAPADVGFVGGPVRQ